MELGQNSAIPPNRIYRYPFSTLCGGNTHYSMFSFFGSEKTKTENARPQNNKSQYISIKTQELGQNSTIPPNRISRYPFSILCGGNSHYSIFSYFGSEKAGKTENQNFENGTSLFSIDPCKLL